MWPPVQVPGEPRCPAATMFVAPAVVSEQIGVRSVVAASYDSVLAELSTTQCTVYDALLNSNIQRVSAPVSSLRRAGRSTDDPGGRAGDPAHHANADDVDAAPQRR